MQRREIEEVTYIEVHEIEKYGRHYSDHKFWKKVASVAKKVGATVLRPVFQLYYMLQSDTVPFKHKAYIVGALGYFILPFDLVPESLLPIIGFADDVAVMSFVISVVKDSLTPEIKQQAEDKLTELLRTDKI